MTVHVAWVRNGSQQPSLLNYSIIEDIRTPITKAIIDPTKTTVDFDGNYIEINAYHYAVDNAVHRFKYTVI